jgi:hypothetical protein
MKPLVAWWLCPLCLRAWGNYGEHAECPYPHRYVDTVKLAWVDCDGIPIRVVASA